MALTSASPARVLRAFLDARDLAGWWGVERSLVETSTGGVYAVTWGLSEHGFRYVTTGTIGLYEPERILRIDHYTYFSPDRPILGPMSLMIQVARTANDTTSIEVVQDGYRDGADWDWYYEAVVTAWPQALEALVRYLSTKP
jgi:hypothetical protein